MPKHYFLLLIPAVVGMAEFGPKIVLGPEQRTSAFFALERQWNAHWPFETGKNLPMVLLPGVLPGAPVWYQFAPHVKMRLDPDDLGPRMILETGQYETGSFNMVREHLSAGATFVDVGANFGIYSLQAAPLVGPAGHVIAIEPNPESVRLLQANIAANDDRAIMVAPVACSDTESTLDLYVAPRSNTGETSLSPANAGQDGKVARSYRVRTRPLDEIIRESGVTRVDAIKIDVEGAEYLVLKGAQQTLDRFHPMLLIEVVEHQLHAMGASSAELKEFLQAHGYREGRHDDLNVEFLPTSSTAAIGMRP